MKLKSILLLSAGMLAFGSSFGQSMVTTGAVKYTLLEEGTGSWCGWCPDGSQRIQKDIEPTMPRAIVVSFHNKDSMALTGDPFSAAYMTGFPGACIDRDTFTHWSTSISPAGFVLSNCVNRGYWAYDIANRRDKIAPTFTVSMHSTFDSLTRELKIEVKAKALIAQTGDYRINGYVVEDSVTSAITGYKQSSYLDTDPASWYYGKGSVLPASWYSHMGVVRKVLASGDNIYGDVAFTNPKVGDSIVKSYTYTLPTTIKASTVNWKHCRVVGLVQKYGSAVSNRPIENCIRANVKGMYKNSPLSLANVSNNIEDVSISPNPAANNIFVQCSFNALTPSATTITIVNVTGQVVMQKEFAAGGSLFAENISLKDLSNGLYFMNVSNAGVTATRQFVINR